MASKAVNVPTNQQQKEKDVNAKLQLYGIYSAFANGKVPSNKQIDVALNSALSSKALASPSKKLSTEGQQLVGDLRDVIEKAKILLLTKNDGNLLQDFIWQTQQLTGGNAAVPGAPVDKETAKQHGNEALEGLRTLGTLIISNGQFRKLLSDATILLRDIAGDGAQKAANKVNPGEEQLSQIDRPAADNTWHEVPDLSRDNLTGQLKSRVPFSKGDAQKAAGDVTQAGHPDGSRDPADAAELAQSEAQNGGSSGLNANAAAGELRNQASDNVPDEKKDKLREQRERTNNYLRSKMPKERREQTIWRLKKMVVEIQGHQDYLRAVDTLLRLAEEYTGHSKNLAQQGKGTVKGAHTDDSLQLAEADLKTLIERFANNTSSDDLFDSINQIYRDAEKDPELKNWFKQLDTYIRKCLKQQGYIMEDRSTDEWNELYDHGHFLLRERYRGHTDRIVDEFKYFGQEFDNDPQNKAFGNSLQTLFQHLGNDENGKPTFKPHLIKDLTEVIIPGIFENIRYVPIPRIEYSDPMMDAIVENLVIEGDNLAPNVLELSSDNYWRWGRKKISNKNKNKVMLSVSGVQMDLKDVSYYVKKKEGFPSITDTGVCDVFMGGNGFSFKVEMETADKTDTAHFFKVNKVNVEVKNLNIKLKQSKHKLLFGLFKPLLLKVMRPVIQKVLEKQIKDNIHQLDGLIYDVKTEADAAVAEAKRNPDPENVQNIYQRYVSAANKKILQGKQKKEEVEAKTADKHVNVAVTQEDSIFKNISLPGGISTKATEFKQLARKGDKWESPVFSIGSAKETSNLPKTGAVSRKRGTVAGAGAGIGAGAGNEYGAGGLTQNRTVGNGGYENSNSNGFGGQLDNAFNTGATNGGVNGALPSSDPYHTTMGKQNPVLQGSV
ncbi:uncharacterized protein BDZ99DRAFT_466036 [Mytilinidion resinicola]|uniref:Bactericidal permeability-increasing protein n=1 Tax=Mytilinidion resinicola TaxID=574789 RepID=A0A6A6YCB5_9PEZI|nr:uncharacterized protein BDZ99DRAFT_466036 [Mytilinidion resinicola]KAF2806466.1 hypothetical protein BDZ99DRAFT_466036 [Mytilinidion resinicola]